MGKTFCKNGKKLEAKSKGRKNTYICTRCRHESPKEKWCCKPKKIKR